MRRAIQTTIRLIYPPRCLGCGDLVESDLGLCGRCWRETNFISGLVCDLCGAPLPGQSDRIEYCDDCLDFGRPWSRGRSALSYREVGRKLVLALKHGDRHDIARPAARWMHRAGASLLEPDVLIVPVPIHWSRLMRRRFNQSALLARALAQEAQLTYCPDFLVRTARTAPLSGKDREERFKMLSGAIEANPRRAAVARGTPVVLIDDVMTSGATLAAAAEASLAGGASQVSILTLARAHRDA